MIFALTDKQRRFMRRMRVLQEEYKLPWEDATAIANRLELITKAAEQRTALEKPPRSEDGPAVG